MNHENFLQKRRYALSVYWGLVLLAVLVGVLGFFTVKENPPLQSLVFNVATEIGGAAIIFFIVNAIFALDQTDLNELNYKIDTIVNDTAFLKKSNDAQNFLALTEQIRSLQNMVEGLTGDFDQFNKRVIGEFSAQQKELMNSLQIQFQQQISSSRHILEQAITKDIASILPTETTRKAVRDVMFEHLGQVIYTMTQYQALAMEREFANALTQATTKVGKSVEEINKEMRDMKSKINTIQSLIPIPRKGR